jgi:PKD repeat protein
MVGNITSKFEFNASASYDPDGFIIYWNWEFGDGTTGWGENVSHVFSDDGSYEVNFTVTDNDRVKSDRFSLTILIQNLPPSAIFTANRTQIMVGESVRFDASNSSDPDDTNLTYSWDFGDGNDGEGEEIVQYFSESGIYSVELTVKDDDEDNDTYKITIEVTEQPVEIGTSANFFSNIWNMLSLSLIFILIALILTLIITKRRNENDTQIRSEPISPALIETSCPDCGQIFEIPEESRPLQIECPNCGTKGLIR